MHYAAAPRTNERIASRDIGSGASAAERTAFARVIAQVAVRGCAVGIREIRRIEEVKDLYPEFGSEPLPELEVLEYREVQVFEAGIPEDVPAHSAKSSGHRRNHDRVAIYEAATLGCGERRDVRGDFARTGKRRGERGSEAADPGCGRATNTREVSATAREKVRRKATAVGNGTCAGLEVLGVPEEIPAIGDLSVRGVPAQSVHHAEGVLCVIYGPRLGGLHGQDGVELPAFQ